jgi:hypothetical protein
MKKILLLVIVSCLLSFCSSDSSSSSDDTILLKKIIHENENGSTTITTYVYDGKKMKTVSNGTYVSKFYYSGNLVTKVEGYINNLLASVFTFEYDTSEKLVQYKLVSSDISRSDRYTYVYNNDNTISVNHYTAIDDDNETLRTEKYFLGIDSEIIKIERYYSNGTSTTLYTYDSKNNPFRNVIGLDKLLNILSEGIKHNTLTKNETAFDSADILTERVIIYNAQDYPLTVQLEGSNDAEQYYY